LQIVNKRLIDFLKLILLVPVLIVATEGQVSAQDLQFSQYYAAPLYLNPGLAGINQQGRAGVNYRNQWPSIPNSFETFSAFIDYYLEDYSSSVGFIVTSDREGLVGLRSTTVGLQYAYEVYLNYDWAFRPGIQASYTLRDVNFDKLVFGDQLTASGIQNPTRENFNTGQNVGYFDLALGGILYNKNIWVGMSYFNLLEPNQAIIDKESVLFRRFSLHGGYKFLIGPPPPRVGKSRERSITPTFNYKTQSRFDQLDIGVYTTLEPIFFGLWYRGIPIKTFESFPNNESLIFMVGVIQNNISIGYSYDYTLSNLGIAAGGAHELSVLVSFNWGDPRKPSRDVRQLKCPVPFQF
jgi:type IX secretion system PorP/SprF family membrane protein